MPQPTVWELGLKQPVTGLAGECVAILTNGMWKKDLWEIVGKVHSLSPDVWEEGISFVPALAVIPGRPGMQLPLGPLEETILKRTLRNAEGHDEGTLALMT